MATNLEGALFFFVVGALLLFIGLFQKKDASAVFEAKRVGSIWAGVFGLVIGSTLLSRALFL